jgi:hypothetical protein
MDSITVTPPSIADMRLLTAAQRHKYAVYCADLVKDVDGALDHEMKNGVLALVNEAARLSDWPPEYWGMGELPPHAPGPALTPAEYGR